MNNQFDAQDYVAPLKKLAKTSKAKLAGVACFVIKNGAIVSSGVNHNPTGAPMEDEVDGKLVSRPEVIHAEVAALQAAAQNGIDLSGTSLLLNISPCLKCAGAIAETDIQEVLYVYEWWDKAGLMALEKAGIKTRKVEA